MNDRSLGKFMVWRGYNYYLFIFLLPSVFFLYHFFVSSLLIFPLFSFFSLFFFYLLTFVFFLFTFFVSFLLFLPFFLSFSLFFLLASLLQVLIISSLPSLFSVSSLFSINLLQFRLSFCTVPSSFFPVVIHSLITSKYP